MAPKTVVAPEAQKNKVVAPEAQKNKVVAPVNSPKVSSKSIVENVPQKVVVAQEAPKTEAQKVVAPASPNALKNNANEFEHLMKELPYFNDISTGDTPSIKVPEKPEEIIKIITKIKKIAAYIDEFQTYKPAAVYSKTLSNRIVERESQFNKNLQKQFRLLEAADVQYNASAHTNATSITSSKITNLENPEQQKKTPIAKNVHLNTLDAKKNPQVNDLNKQEIKNNQGIGSSKVNVLPKEIIDEDKNFKNILLNIKKLQEEEALNPQKKLTSKSTYDEILAASRINRKDDNIKKKITQLKLEATASRERCKSLFNAHIEATKQETINLALKNADQTALNLPNKTLANLTSSNPSNTGTSVKTAKNASTPSPNTTASIPLNPATANTTTTKPSTTNPATANTAIKPTNTINPANPTNPSTKITLLNPTNPAKNANTQTIKNATTLAKTNANALYKKYINYERTKIEIEAHKKNLNAIANKANGFSFLRDILDIHTGTIWNTFVPNAFIGDPHRVEKRIAYLEKTILPNTQTEYNTLKKNYDNAVNKLNERLKLVSEQQTQASTINAHNTTLKLKQTEFATEKSLLDAKFNDDTQKIILAANKQFDTEFAANINDDLSEATKNNATATATATAISKLTNTNQKHSLISQEPLNANLPSLSNTTQTDPIYANVPVPLKGGKRTILTKKQKHTIRNKCVRSHKSHNKKLRKRKTHLKRRTMLKKHKLN